MEKGDVGKFPTSRLWESDAVVPAGDERGLGRSGRGGKLALLNQPADRVLMLALAFERATGAVARVREMIVRDVDEVGFLAIAGTLLEGEARTEV